MTAQVLAAAVSAAAFVAAFAAPASANPFSSDANRSIELRFEKSELARAGGPERIYRKIERTARKACVSSTRKTLFDRAREQACYDALVADLVAQIGDRRLAAIHLSLGAG